MANLFIIGNGFDDAHELTTNYQNFRNYLLDEYSDINMYDPIIPDPEPQPDGGMHYDDKEVLSLLFFLINEAEEDESIWTKVEESLGNLDYSVLYDGLDDMREKDGTKHDWHTAYRNEDIALNLITPITSIQEYFSEWINSINLENVIPKTKFEDLIEINDVFLTFNYTETLEEVYEVDKSKICHIHGHQHGEMIFGHGNDKNYTERYMGNHVGSEDGLSKIDRNLRKKTDYALESNKEFFESLETTHIEAIYSYGFSFNPIDRIYIEEICNRLNTKNITFYLDDYNIDDNKKKISFIKECGFKGEFSLFSLS